MHARLQQVVPPLVQGSPSTVQLLPPEPVSAVQVPELLQGDCTPDRLETELVRLLTDEAARQAQLAGFGEALSRIGLGGELPSFKAAEKILALVRERGGSAG